MKEQVFFLVVRRGRKGKCPETWNLEFPGCRARCSLVPKLPLLVISWSFLPHSLDVLFRKCSCEAPDVRCPYPTKRLQAII